jgi:hypothetical protein
MATVDDAVTGIGHDVVKTHRFPSHPQADGSRALAPGQLRPRLV